jgi:hypothetical protein
MILLQSLKKRLVSWRNRRDPMTEFGCENISIQPESSTRNLGAPPLYIGDASRLGRRALAPGLHPGCNPLLKLTNPAGVLGVWSISRGWEDSDTFSLSQKCVKME